VARLSKVSIFSDLKKRSDISFSNKSSAICGITSEELDHYFCKGIEELAITLRMSQQSLKKQLKNNYDGYHFSELSPDIYNPFSLISVFARETLGDFWFSSGTPEYLFRLIQRGQYPLSDISPSTIDRRHLESAGLLDSDPIPAFYQSGYLTIKSYDPEFNEYTLGYPNEEVKYGFLKFLMRNYEPRIDRRGFSIPDFVKEIRAGKPEGFMKRMESLIASVPYNEKGLAEAHFQNAVYLLFTLIGQYTKMEDRTSDGRIDLQVETAEYIYIFEFKIDSSSEKAMEQILEKKYWLREAVSGKKIFLIGANFDSSTRRMTEPIIATPPESLQ
ncbi:MAG: ATP-binding protein, partial [Muribaculaceae bacterium]|nr:ATP-binding protein [Muribaculaceae bacterium]